MWPIVIIVISPLFNEFSGVIVVHEQMCIKALIAQFTIEALNKAILLVSA